MDVIFDGIGTEIISLIFGAIVGGTVGYKIGSKSKQSQGDANERKDLKDQGQGKEGQQEQETDAKEPRTDTSLHDIRQEGGHSVNER